MMKTNILIFLFCFLTIGLTSCSEEKTDGTVTEKSAEALATEERERSIELEAQKKLQQKRANPGTPAETFESFKMAVISGDGVLASNFAGPKTIAFYQKVKDQVLHASKSEVKAMPFMHKIMILTIRMRMTANDIEALNPDAFFMQIVDLGILDKTAVGMITSRPAQINGDEASSSIDFPQINTNAKLYFQKDSNGVWKIDAAEAIEEAANAYNDIATDRGMDLEPLINQILQQGAGEDGVPANIYEPLK